MIKWYEDKNLKISFSKIPNIKVRFFIPNISEDEEKNINEKPFLNLEELDVLLSDISSDKNYNFTILKDYSWDGASIPRIFWRSIGAKTDNRFLIPSLIHDVLCENHSLVDNDRYFADKVFERLLYVSHVSPFKRWLMFHSVDNFQKFKGWNDGL